MLNKRNKSSKMIWTYGYQIVPPQAEDRLRTVTSLLEHENSAAQLGDRTWAGRVIVEQQITHILVVTDTPEQNREVNRKLEAELKELNVGFSITVPMAVADDEAAWPLIDRPPGEQM